MLINSFNFRGHGGRFKKNKARELFFSKSLDFMVIQETKLNDVTLSISNSLWGISFCDWSLSPLVENNCGILLIW